MMVYFLTILFLPAYATLLSDRSIPSLRESAMYYIKDTISGVDNIQEHRRDGNVTSVMNESGNLTVTFTESNDGKEVLTDIVGNKILVKIVFPRPLFSLNSDEEMRGTLYHINRASGHVIKSTPILLKVKKLSDIITHTYLMINDDTEEVKINTFKTGQRLPFKIGAQKTAIKTGKIISQIILIKQ